MPVEIKELIIRASVLNGSAQSQKAGHGMSYEEREELIAACTEQVLKILQRKNER